MVAIAQLVRVPGCGPGGRGFESRWPPHLPATVAGDDIRRDRRPRPAQSFRLEPVGRRVRGARAQELGGSEPSWGIWGIPESEVHLLPDVDGLDVIELGCGTAYVSAWLARRGARPVGIDLSENQLATARALQDEHDLHFPARPVQRRGGAHSPTPPSTWRSASTAPRSGATRIAGSRRPRGCSARAAG